MATLKEYFYNVKCDYCNKIADEETWQNEEGIIRGEIMPEENWKTLGGKDYCPDCWHYDDDDNIVTADGHVWNGDTYKLIKQQAMANLPRKITINVWNEETTPYVLAVVIRELPRKGVSVFNITKAGMVAVSK